MQNAECKNDRLFCILHSCVFVALSLKKGIARVEFLTGAKKGSDPRLAEGRSGPDDLRRLISLGVDGLCTNAPDVARQATDAP